MRSLFLWTVLVLSTSGRIGQSMPRYFAWPHALVPVAVTRSIPATLQNGDEIIEGHLVNTQIDLRLGPLFGMLFGIYSLKEPGVNVSELLTIISATTSPIQRWASNKGPHYRFIVGPFSLEDYADSAATPEGTTLETVEFTKAERKVLDQVLRGRKHYIRDRLDQGHSAPVAIDLKKHGEVTTLTHVILVKPSDLDSVRVPVTALSPRFDCNYQLRRFSPFPSH